MSNVAILYCGSSFAKSLFDKLASFKVRPFLMPSDTSMQQLALINPMAIIISGSPVAPNHPLSPKVNPEIYVSGGGKASDPNSPLADCRQEAICDFLLLENLLGEVLSDVFTGAENRIEIIVYWPRPNDGQ